MRSERFRECENCGDAVISRVCFTCLHAPIEIRKKPETKRKPLSKKLQEKLTERYGEDVTKILNIYGKTKFKEKIRH